MGAGARKLKLLVACAWTSCLEHGLASQLAGCSDSTVRTYCGLPFAVLASGVDQLMHATVRLWRTVAALFVCFLGACGRKRLGHLSQRCWFSLASLGSAVQLRHLGVRCATDLCRREDRYSTLPVDIHKGSSCQFIACSPVTLKFTVGCHDQK